MNDTTSGKRKEEIVTFKVDHTFAEMLRNLPNKSEFIRHAVLRALENECPLCNGAGTLTPKQLEHWKEFALHHEIRKCRDCEETHIVCELDDPAGVEKSEGSGNAGGGS